MQNVVVVAVGIISHHIGFFCYLFYYFSSFFLFLIFFFLFFSYSGRPQPRLTWWHENYLLDDTFTAISEKTVKNELYVEKLQRHHLHTVLTCQASNNNITSPISAVVTLNLNCKYLLVVGVCYIVLCVCVCTFCCHVYIHRYSRIFCEEADCVWVCL